MDEYAGFALASELAKLAGVHPNNIYGLKGIDQVKVGNYVAVRVDQLPEKYRPDGWHDLGEHLPNAYFEELIGVSDCFCSTRMAKNDGKFKSVKLAKTRLIPTTEEFRRLLRKGMVPFLLRGKEKYAEIITEMHGIELGWY